MYFFLDYVCVFLFCVCVSLLIETGFFFVPNRRPGILVLINDADWELMVSKVTFTVRMS